MRQTQGFRNFIPAPNCWSGCPNPQAIYNTHGTPCPASHPNTQPPNCATPQQIQCDACMGGSPAVPAVPYQPATATSPEIMFQPAIPAVPGSPVTNMFPGPSCPPNWSPHTSGVNPCNPVLPPPLPSGITSTFINNMNSGFNRFGCSFFYNRHSHLTNKLNQLQSAGTNPNWQQMLQNRINYVNQQISTNCIGGPMPPPPPPKKPIPTPPGGGIAIPTGPMMNASGDVGTTNDIDKAVRVSQVVGLWFN